MTFVDTAELWLFDALVSFAAATEAVLEIDPVTVTATVARMVTIAVSLGFNAGMVTEAVFPVAVTVPAVFPPMVEVPETKVNPVGSASVTATLVAVDGPELVTFSV